MTSTTGYYHLYQAHQPYKTTGVSEFSPLFYFPLFNLIWDVCIDAMHTVPGWVKSHLFPLLRGTRAPSRPKERKLRGPSHRKGEWTKHDNQNLQNDYETVCDRLGRWKIPKDHGLKLDKRSRDLAGEPQWFRTNIEVYSRGGRLKTHDWMQVVKYCSEYIFHDLFPPDSVKTEALDAYFASMRALLEATSAHDSDNRDEIDVIKLQCVKALSLLEAVIPKTELSPLLHITIHLPDFIWRWNSVRNFWCFFGERCVPMCICRCLNSLFIYHKVVYITFSHLFFCNSHLFFVIGVWATSSASSTTEIWQPRTSSLLTSVRASSSPPHRVSSMVSRTACAIMVSDFQSVPCSPWRRLINGTCGVEPVSTRCTWPPQKLQHAASISRVRPDSRQCGPFVGQAQFYGSLKILPELCA